MRSLILALLLCSVAWCQCGPGQVLAPVGRGASSCKNTDKVVTKDASGNLAVSTTVLGPYVIQAAAGKTTLPAAAAGNTGYITVVTDGTSGADCTTGGGASAALCRSNGSAWVAMGGGSTPAGVCQPTVYVTQYTDNGFKTAATTVTSTLFTLADRERICGIDIQPVNAFAGTGVTSLTLALGSPTSGNSALYFPAVTVGPAMAANARYGFGGLQSPGYAATPDTSRDVVLSLTSNTNVGNGSATILTAGKISVTIWRATAPAIP